MKNDKADPRTEATARAGFDNTVIVFVGERNGYGTQAALTIDEASSLVDQINAVIAKMDPAR